MRIDADRALVQMTDRQPLRLTDAEGIRLRGVAGTTWVTIDDDLRDLILEPGDELLITSPRPVFATAISGCATLDVVSAGRRASLMQRSIDWLTRQTPRPGGASPPRLAA